MANITLQKETIKKEIKSLTSDELLFEYGIIINGDGSIYDDLNNSIFSTIDEWLDDYLMEPDDGFEKFSKSGWYDDE